MATHLAQGAGIVPAADNPLRTDGGVGPSVQQTVEDTMQKALEDGEVPANEELDKGKAEQSVEDVAKQALAESGDDDKPDGEAPTKTDGEAGDGAQEAELGPLEPPANWSADDQEVFRGCNEEVQKWVQGFAERQIEPLQKQVEATQPVAKVLQTYDSYLKQLGQPADRVLEGLLQTEYLLRTGTPQQKAQALNRIIQDYGVQTEAPAAPALPEEVAGDPVAQAFHPVLNQVMERLDHLNNRFENNQQQAATYQQQSAAAALETFQNQKDDKGNLLHPYYGEVLATMEALANQANATGQQVTLEQVYENACMANPGVRAKIESAKQAASIRERQSKAADKSKASKSVASSPGTARTDSIEVKPDESAYDTAMRAAAAHGITLS